MLSAVFRKPSRSGAGPARRGVRRRRPGDHPLRLQGAEHMAQHGPARLGGIAPAVQFVHQRVNGRSVMAIWRGQQMAVCGVGLWRLAFVQRQHALDQGSTMRSWRATSAG